MDSSLKAYKKEVNINKWYHIELRSVCTAKKAKNKIKKKMEGEKIFANDLSGKGILSKLCKKF